MRRTGAKRRLCHRGGSLARRMQESRRRLIAGSINSLSLPDIQYGLQSCHAYLLVIIHSVLWLLKVPIAGHPPPEGRVGRVEDRRERGTGGREDRGGERKGKGKGVLGSTVAGKRRVRG